LISDIVNALEMSGVDVMQGSTMTKAVHFVQQTVPAMCMSIPMPLCGKSNAKHRLTLKCATTAVYKGLAR